MSYVWLSFNKVSFAAQKKKTALDFETILGFFIFIS
jgi:hypothetical protein